MKTSEESSWSLANKTWNGGRGSLKLEDESRASSIRSGVALMYCAKGGHVLAEALWDEASPVVKMPLSA